ncbi:MAG TPA: hypothetical protein VFZ87_11090, partial [Gemmatimonadales bacterium]
MIQLGGLVIHDPDVVFTDLALALLGGYFGWRLWRIAGRPFTRTGAVLMFALASAALFGAIFHAFFPEDTATPPGFVAWIPVSLSIVIAAAAMLDLAMTLLLPGAPPKVRRAVVRGYAAVFAAVVLLVDESFGSIVRFYVPALLLFLIAAAREVLRRRPGWSAITAGLLISVGAALLQQAEVAIHPDYFDHNAV